MGIIINLNDILLSAVLIALLILLVYLIILIKKTIYSVERTNNVLDSLEGATNESINKLNMLSDGITIFYGLLKDGTLLNLIGKFRSSKEKR